MSADILIVDDEADIRDLVAGILDDEGHRTRTAAAVDETIPATVDVEKQVVDAALVERVIAEVGTLSPLDQQIFRLCAAEGYAYQAAADELGVSHAVVRNRLSRIRIRLRTTIEPEST